jgi:hypothetical protein
VRFSFFFDIYIETIIVMHKNTIILTENELKNVIAESVKKVLQEEYDMNEGRIGKALGTLALGGALALGSPTNTNAQQYNTQPKQEMQIAQQGDVKNYTDSLKTVQNDTLKTQSQITDKHLADDIYELVKSNHSLDDIYGAVMADYELIYQVEMDAQTMYKNLMSKLYSIENVSVNELDGMFQITIKDESYDKRTQKVDSRCIYKFYLKDGRFKITAKLTSKSAYKWWNFDANNTLGDIEIKLPRIKISNWASGIVKGSSNEFDF